MERRIRSRQPVDVQVTCRVPATPYKARMLDATRTGCRLSLRSVRLERGGSITIELADGTAISGRVMWRTALETGVEFEAPLRTPVAVLLGIEDGGEDPVADACPEAPSLRRPAA